MLCGLTGEARCGKDTAAKMLDIKEYHFAKPMKEACKIIFGWNDEHMYGDLKEVIDPNFGISPRMALQTIGTDWGREIINKDLWIKRAQIEINRSTELVISDVRFDNEAELIKRNGGIIIRIERDSKQEIRAHKSEAGVSDHLIDTVIYNNGTLEELKQKVLAI